MSGGLRVAALGAGCFSQFHVEAWTAMMLTVPRFLPLAKLADN